VEFPDSSGTPLACPGATTRGNDPVSEKTIASVALNPIPVDQVWARGIQQGGPISLGFCYCSNKVFQKAPSAQCWWSFFMSILVNDTWC